METGIPLETAAGAKKVVEDMVKAIE